MGMSYSKEWSLWSSHGIVLVFIALRPNCTVAEIADALSLTPRTVWGIVGDLRRAEALRITRDGRRHRYAVNTAASFRHPTLEDIPVGLVLGELMASADYGSKAAAVSS
jgi:hypothetical protein